MRLLSDLPLEYINKYRIIAFMSSNASSLPKDPQELAKIIDNLTRRNEQLEAKVRWFEEQFHLARHKQFGASSKKSSKEQRNLFNEDEAIV